MQTAAWLAVLAGALALVASAGFARSLFAGQAGLGLLEPIDASGPLAHMPALLKVLAVVALVLAAALMAPARLWVAAVLLAAAAIHGRLPLGALFRRIGELAPFALLASFGLLLRGDLATVATALTRAMITVTALTLLASTTRLPDLLVALRRLGLPPALAGIVGLTVRYLTLLADEAQRVALAFSARAVGPRDLRLARPLGRMIGSLAVRSLERGERVHAAMLARGYEGVLPILHRQPAMHLVHGAAMAAWLGVLGATVWLP